MTDGEVFWKISKGCWRMPGFGDRLNETQRWQLVDYLRALSRPETSRRAGAVRAHP